MCIPSPGVEKRRKGEKEKRGERTTLRRLLAVYKHVQCSSELEKQTRPDRPQVQSVRPMFSERRTSGNLLDPIRYLNRRSLIMITHNPRVATFSWPTEGRGSYQLNHVGRGRRHLCGLEKEALVNSVQHFREERRPGRTDNSRSDA